MVAVAKTKMMVMPASRMLSAISFGVFWRSAPSTKAIMRSRKVEPCAAVMRTLSQSETTSVPPVTADRSPPDSRMTGADFAGDRRLVDGGHAFDHLAVGGDDVAGLHQNHLTWAKLFGRRGHDKPSPLIDDELGLGLLAGLAQARGLRLAAPFGHGFGKIGEQDGEPQPNDDLKRKAEVIAAVDPMADEDDRGKRGDHLDHEHHRVLHHDARVELGEGRADGGPRRSLDRSGK